MNSIDYYKSLELDTSIVLNFPKGMTGVLSAVETFLKNKGRIIVPEGNISVDRAREIVAGATGDLKTFYQIQNSDPKVWNILREAVNEERIRILAIFHGQIPSEVPSNVVTLDIGRSLHRKVSKPVSAALTSAIGSKGKYPVGKAEDLYYATVALCYETLYSPEGRMFPRSVADSIPKAHAFDFMYNPPNTLTEASMTSAVNQFVGTLHDWM